MFEAGSGADRRQFGRRPVDAAATAVLKGNVEVACTIEDISDGGARLHFPSGLAPTQSFHLSVDDTSHSLLCEIRHRNGPILGVRFISLAEGIALNRALQRPTLVPAPEDAPVRRVVEQKPQPRWSVREMRKAVLGITEPVEAAPAPADVLAAPAIEAAEPRQAA